MLAVVLHSDNSSCRNLLVFRARIRHLEFALPSGGSPRASGSLGRSIVFPISRARRLPSSAPTIRGSAAGFPARASVDLRFESRYCRFDRSGVFLPLLVLAWSPRRASLMAVSAHQSMVRTFVGRTIVRGFRRYLAVKRIFPRLDSEPVVCSEDNALFVTTRIRSARLVNYLCRHSPSACVVLSNRWADWDAVGRRRFATWRTVYRLRQAFSDVGTRRASVLDELALLLAKNNEATAERVVRRVAHRSRVGGERSDLLAGLPWISTLC